MKTAQWIISMRDELKVDVPVCILWDGNKYFALPVFDSQEMRRLQYKNTFIKTFR